MFRDSLRLHLFILAKDHFFFLKKKKEKEKEISLVNVTKSAGNSRFDRIGLKKLSKKYFT